MTTVNVINERCLQIFMNCFTSQHLVKIQPICERMSLEEVPLTIEPVKPES